MTHDAEYEAQQLLPFIGGKIVEVSTDPDKEYFCLVVQKGKKKYQLWIDSDEEGNECGAECGAVNIVEVPK